MRDPCSRDRWTRELGLASLRPCVAWVNICHALQTSRAADQDRGAAMPNAFASPGSMNVDWEERWNVDRLRDYRFGRARDALAASDVGAVLLFDFNNIRYVTSTHIGEWARDKMTRYALLTRGGEPHIWDFGSAAEAPPRELPVAAPGEHPRRDGRPARRGRPGRRPVPVRRARDPRDPGGRGRGRHAARRGHRRAADAGRARGRGHHRPRRPAGHARRPRDQVGRRDHPAQRRLRDGRRRLPADLRAAQAGRSARTSSSRT